MRSAFTCIFLSIASLLCAQQKSPFEKFGNITAEDLQKKSYPVDSNANAVVLSDIGSTAIVGNNKGGFSFTFTRHRVVRILNKNGYPVANNFIDVYTDGEDEEKIESLRAVTYNLEDGKIVESKLDKSSLFKEKIDRYHLRKRFTFPNVKDGSIIEYELTMTSDFLYHLMPWDFQGSIPVLWSEYNLSLPQFFIYAFVSHGYQPFYINDKKDHYGRFNVANTGGVGFSSALVVNAIVTDYRWVMKDVPKLEGETFTSSPKNFVAHIEFQLNGQVEPLQKRDFRNTWEELGKELMTSAYFGKELEEDSSWLAPTLLPVVEGASSATEKAKRIYAFVRDHFTCTDHSALWKDQSLENVLKTKSGNVAEINLLLTAMLRWAGLQADPVILSTTSHGYTQDVYPLTDNFNYVIVRCTADGKMLNLDATRPRLGFGNLLPECYNGHARLIADTVPPLYLMPDSLLEKKVTSVYITNGDNGIRIGSIRKTLGNYSSYETRNTIIEKGVEEYRKSVQSSYLGDIVIKTPQIDSLTNYERPLSLQYDVELPKITDDVYYINPFFAEGLKKNPFKSEDRLYPVEMPYTTDDTYFLTMTIPEGYEVEELPKQMLVNLDASGKSFFEYRIEASGSTVSLRCRVKIARTFFTPEEYQLLRQFYGLIVNKENEQIVLRKKK